MNNNTFTATTTASNTSNASQPRRRGRGWSKAEKLALIKAYRSNVFFPHSPTASDAAKKERWYRDYFREASASLGRPLRNDDAILICWRNLRRKYKEEHAKRHATGSAAPPPDQIYEKMDEMFGTLPTTTAPYVYSSFTRTFTDNREGASTTQARRPSVSADDQPDVSRRRVSSPPTTTTTASAPTATPTTTTTARPAPATTTPTATPTATTTTAPAPATTAARPTTTYLPPFNPTALTSHGRNQTHLTDLFRNVLEQHATLQDRGHREMRETIAAASAAANEAREAALASMQARFLERMERVEELARTASERRERQIEELMNIVRRQNPDNN